MCCASSGIYSSYAPDSLVGCTVPYTLTVPSPQKNPVCNHEYVCMCHCVFMCFHYVHVHTHSAPSPSPLTTSMPATRHLHLRPMKPPPLSPVSPPSHPHTSPSPHTGKGEGEEEEDKCEDEYEDPNLFLEDQERIEMVRRVRVLLCGSDLILLEVEYHVWAEMFVWVGITFLSSIYMLS